MDGRDFIRPVRVLTETRCGCGRTRVGRRNVEAMDPRRRDTVLGLVTLVCGLILLAMNLCGPGGSERWALCVCGAGMGVAGLLQIREARRRPPG